MRQIVLLSFILLFSLIISCSDDEQEQEIARSELPAVITSAIQDTFPGFKITDAEIETEEEEITYEVEGSIDGKNYEIEITSDGKIIEFEEDEVDEDDDNDDAKFDGSLIYDHNPLTQPGDSVFGTIIADMQHDHPERCSHGSPVALEYANGHIAAFYANTSDHNIDGWCEYALSKDGGKTWDKYNKLPYSYDAYQQNPEEPAWAEEGIVTSRGTAVLFVSHFKDGERSKTGMIRSLDNGSTWTEYDPIDAGFTGYPCAAAVSSETNYVLIDSNEGPHVLYVSTDDGQSWKKRSTLTLDDDKWYGAMCIMADGRLLAGAYTEKDEAHFYYCISEDNGKTWGKQKSVAVCKKIRDPELAYLSGRYYLHGRSGHNGSGAHRFVLYESKDGENWDNGRVVSSNERGPDGYSHNCIIHKYDKSVPNELMVLYSIVYEGRDTDEYVFFVKPERLAENE